MTRATTSIAAPRTRLLPADVLGVGLLGVRMRPTRAALSALGIAIGIAAIVGVTGISASSRAGLVAQLDRLGTNLLTIGPGKSLTRGPVELPSSTSASVRRIGLVESAGSIGAVIGTGVRRSPYIPSFETGGIGVLAAEPDVAAAAGAALRSGQFLTAATARYPVAVLGATAAAHLGIEDVGAGLQVWIAGRPFLVIGVLDPVGLAPELDRSVLVGWQEAMTDLSFDGHPTEAFVRSDPASVVTVRDVLAPTIDPEHPEEIAVSRPSDVLAARAAASDTLTGLLVGLGLVALLVGAIGIANVLLIGVIERRTEIGLRRALGATRRHVATQFLVEAIALGAIGGAVGCAAGVLVTVFYAFAHGWPAALPVELLLGAIGGSVAIASLAGTYPALRAGRLAPMTALRSA